MSSAQEACHRDTHCLTDTKKGLLQTVLSHPCSEDILRKAEPISADLRALQQSRKPALRISRARRLKSISITDPIRWLLWMYPNDLPPHIRHCIARLAEGDAKTEAAILQIRTEMGL